MAGRAETNRPVMNAPDRLAERHELKVRLPLSLHIRLHSLKILEHRNIATILEEALELYFAHHEAGPEAGDVSSGPDRPLP